MPYVFGYGSLVDRASIEATLDRELGPSAGPFPLRLKGYRRAWNVVGHSGERPDYLFTSADGSPWSGWVAFLGLEAAAGQATPGAAWRVGEADLPRLDARERSYSRVDVTSLVEVVTPPGPSGPVLTYVPRSDVAERADGLGRDALVMARYLRLVDRAFRGLGGEMYAEHLATFPSLPPSRVVEIQVQPSAPGARNEAVDPKGRRRTR